MKANTPGPPMTSGNMRWQGVHHLVAFCPQRRLSADFVAKVEKLQAEEFFAKLSNEKQSPIRIASLVLAKSLVSFT
jgi:hypothetical protein